MAKLYSKLTYWSCWLNIAVSLLSLSRLYEKKLSWASQRYTVREGKRNTIRWEWVSEIIQECGLKIESVNIYLCLHVNIKSNLTIWCYTVMYWFNIYPKRGIGSRLTVNEVFIQYIYRLHCSDDMTNLHEEYITTNYKKKSTQDLCFW